VVCAEIPETLAREIRSRGIDIIDLVASAIHDVDPSVIARARLELAERYIREAEEHAARGDAVQASEKAYKAAEECIKALAEALGTPEAGEARRSGRWFAWLLGRAARTLARRLGEMRIKAAWTLAYDIHVWGFHEAKYGVSDIKDDIEEVKWLLAYARRVVEGPGERQPGGA
jgi:hypothetical protein